MKFTPNEIWGGRGNVSRKPFYLTIIKYLCQLYIKAALVCGNKAK